MNPEKDNYTYSLRVHGGYCSLKSGEYFVPTAQTDGYPEMDATVEFLRVDASDTMQDIALARTLERHGDITVGFINGQEIYGSRIVAQGTSLYVRLRFPGRLYGMANQWAADAANAAQEMWRSFKNSVLETSEMATIGRELHAEH